MRKEPANNRERDEAVWGDMAKAFSTPLARDDSHEEYWATRRIGETFQVVGFDGVAYQSALGQGRNSALFDLEAAHPINRTLFTTKAVDDNFEPANNTYDIPKYYPNWAKDDEIASPSANTETGEAVREGT